MKSICDVSPHVKTRFVKSQKGGTVPGIRTGITVIQKTTEPAMPESKQASKIFGVENIQESRQKFQQHVYKIKTTLQTNNQETNTWMYIVYSQKWKMVQLRLPRCINQGRNLE